MIKKLHLLLACLLCIQVNSIEKRSIPENFTTSIIIPCHHAHFLFLSPLIDEYTKQTKLPDEIVISLSNSQLLNKEDIEKLQNQTNLFPVRIITHERRVSAGENRNIACRQAKGDILICNDADDIPHPQRAEIIKYFFDNYLIDHLAHQFSPSNELVRRRPDLYKNAPTHFEALDIPSLSFINGSGEIYKGYEGIPFIHNGNIAITKEIAAGHKWIHIFGKDKDIDFNVMVSEKNQCVVIHANLIKYQNQYSAFKYDRSNKNSPILINPPAP